MVFNSRTRPVTFRLVRQHDLALNVQMKITTDKRCPMPVTTSHMAHVFGSLESMMHGANSDVSAKSMSFEPNFLDLAFSTGVKTLVSYMERVATNYKLQLPSNSSGSRCMNEKRACACIERSQCLETPGVRHIA